MTNTQPTPIAEVSAEKPCNNPHVDRDTRDEVIRTVFAETAILMTHPNEERRALAKERVYALLYADTSTQNTALADAERKLEEAKRETQSVYRCVIGDAVGAIDVLANKWLGSRRKAEREAGAVVKHLGDLVWSMRSPAAGSYGQAVKSGKRLHGLVKQAFLAAQDGGKG